MIICATRAGEHSRAVHNAGVELAVAEHMPVTFVHVLDGPAFFDQNDAMRSAIREEARWLITALVSMTLSHLDAAEVDTQIAIRHGEPLVEIAAVAREAEATHLVIGEPRAVGASSFAEADFESFLSSMRVAGISPTLI